MADCESCKNWDKPVICYACEGCSYFEEIIITNADRIRSMTDGELAEFLDATVHSSGENLFSCNDWECIECNKCYLKWLQSEAREEQ